MKNSMLPTRREFIKIGAVTGSGLLLGLHLPGWEEATGPGRPKNSGDRQEGMPNAWIKIGRDNTVTIMVSHSEMGQGIATALCMIVAEELEADWSGVRFEMAPVADVYKHPAFGIQWTVSSMSVQSSWERWRLAGAAARELLIAAAVRFWQVPRETCRAERSHVIHLPSQRGLPYADLIFKTDGLTLMAQPPLKGPAEFKIIGRSPRRLDSRPKIDGSAVFGIDVKLPGLLAATVVHPPLPGAKVKSLNARVALNKPGVRQVLAIRTGIAVVADTFWQAKSAVDLLEIEWQGGSGTPASTGQLFDRWRAMGKKEGKRFYQTGEIKDHFKDGAKVLEAAYDLPYQAHATPEPMNCTAHVSADQCEIWAPTQNPKGAQEIAADITGLPNDRIVVQTTFLGGGFGRRALVDYVGEAVEISQKVKAPVKVIWTREEDIRHDFYRPATYQVLQAALDPLGRPIAWRHRIVGADVFAQALPQVLSGMLPDYLPRFVKNMATALARRLLPRFIAGKNAVKGAGPLPYNIPHMQVEFVNDDPGIPICWWRSVAPSTNCFAVESFLDELAAAAGRDPFDLRFELSAPSPRLRRVLKLAAERADWFTSPPPGVYRGMAAHDFQGTMMVLVAEIAVSEKGRVRVKRMVCAVDCGIAVNPGNIAAQVQSAVAFGLTATLKSSITFKEGQTEQSNFHDFPLLRMEEMPRVEVHIAPSTKPPTGIGEVAVPLVGPAVANAVYAALGRRIRKLPITPADCRIPEIQPQMHADEIF
ncbi:MAG: xanthine dehydrogenase family protein molybdopterin-binding subunit [Deltaproteobacteria bacterium]|nr:xanthine dehydrogenase family protein molybdopterin-binding subunit [Deltaproteobacteria bacterium]